MPDGRVCISDYLTPDSGAPGQLGMTRHLPSVFPATFLEGSDTAVLTGPSTDLPGLTLLDATWSVTNDRPFPAHLRLWVFRSSWTAVASNPNVTQIRDRLTYQIGRPAPEPDPTSSYLTQFTSGLDLATNKNAVPLAGVLTRHSGASMHEELIQSVPAGKTVEIRYRIIAWTPPPFSNNANNNSQITEARVRRVRVLPIWLPIPDEG